MIALHQLLEPKRALLVWQSARSNSSRRRWAVGTLSRPSTDQKAPVTLSYHSRDELEGAIAEGFSGYPAFSFRQPVHTHEVLETFMLRLPPRRRADFAEYLAQHLIDPAAEFTDFALLAASEAKLPSDGFSIVNPLDEIDTSAAFVIEAAGIRHVSPILPAINDAVAFMPEPDNEKDSRAIMIKAGSQTIGYINRLQTDAFHRWIDAACVFGRVAKVNGTSDKPRILVMVRVECIE